MDKKFDGIVFRTIIEIMGAPPEHIDRSLRDFVKSLKEWKGLHIRKSDYSEPQQQENLYSMFVELEIEAKDVTELLGFCIEAMPSTVDIVDPEELRFGSQDFSQILNDLQAKLHVVDRRLKELNAQQSMLERNTHALATNLVLVSLKEGQKSLEHLSRNTGIAQEKLTLLLNELTQQGRVKEAGGTYSL